jgi:hypothetical protein
MGDGTDPARLAALLEAGSRYSTVVLTAYAAPNQRDPQRLQDAHTAARLARSNAEAAVDRMLGEPTGRHRVTPHTALGVLAAARRYALAVLTLHAHLASASVKPLPALVLLTRELEVQLAALADALRTGMPLPQLPPLRETQLALVDALAARSAAGAADAGPGEVQLPSAALRTFRRPAECEERSRGSRIDDKLFMCRLDPSARTCAPRHAQSG